MPLLKLLSLIGLLVGSENRMHLFYSGPLVDRHSSSFCTDLLASMLRTCRRCRMSLLSCMDSRLLVRLLLGRKLITAEKLWIEALLIMV